MSTLFYLNFVCGVENDLGAVFHRILIESARRITCRETACFEVFSSSNIHRHVSSGTPLYLLLSSRAYRLQDGGLDTVLANTELGHAADAREYSVGAAIIRHMGISSVRLMTNNPLKIEGLKENGVRVGERVAMPPVSGECGQTKEGHIL